MKRTNRIFALALSLASIAVVATAQQAMMTASNNPMVGGMPMMANKNIVENAVNSKDHTTLVAAVKAAGLVDALMGKGPFTVFAPTNDAFENLPEGTVPTLLKPENKSMLSGVLTYHVVAGNLTSDKIRGAIKKGNGSAMIKTLNGGVLTAKMNGPTNIVLVDQAGGVASISTYDVKQSNGVIHVINKVLMPKM